VYRHLEAARQALAQQYNVFPHTVLPLAQLAQQQQPGGIAELQAVVGRCRAADYGAALLAVLQGQALPAGPLGLDTGASGGQGASAGTALAGVGQQAQQGQTQQQQQQQGPTQQQQQQQQQQGKGQQQASSGADQVQQPTLGASKGSKAAGGSRSGAAGSSRVGAAAPWPAPKPDVVVISDDSDDLLDCGGAGGGAAGSSDGDDSDEEFVVLRAKRARA
jgi:hypothetical protein